MEKIKSENGSVKPANLAADSTDLLVDTATAPAPDPAPDNLLSDGREFKFITPKGRQLIEAQRIAGGDAGRIMAALVCVCTVIDGRKLLIEDFEELPLKDSMTLFNRVSSFL